MRLLRTLAAALAVLLALAACTDDSAPRDPSSTWSPTGTMETPSSNAGQTPTEPALPDAATQASEDGARAFITYYWDLINYAQVTGDVKALKAASGPNCEGCKAGIHAIREIYKGGGHITDGQYEPEIQTLKPFQVQEHDIDAFEAKVTVRNAAHSAVNGDGTATPYAADTSRYLLYVLWVESRWRLDVMELK
ncbi:DUF6318 family protein [Nocardioides humi]|uniref:DUF6318 domain-containing protein n=1 Tax=Nocardioides humi TaxID=449461 RepID=A0ABN2BNM3_9ACTN|nr:DUF6318 family protein [Nocardioides humi]